MSPPRRRTAAVAWVLRRPPPATATALLAAPPPPPSRGRPLPDRLGSPSRSARYLVEVVVAGCARCFPCPRARLDAHPRLERDAALARIFLELERFWDLLRFFEISLLLTLLFGGF